MLRTAGDPATREGMRRYFKSDEDVTFFGVPAPAIRRMVRDLFAEARTRWTYANGLAFCDAMVSRPELDAKLCGILLLARYERHFPAGLLAVARRWLATDRLATWAAVDALAHRIVSPLIERYPNAGPQVRRWASARNVWVRRAAAVSYVPLARRGDRLDDAYAVADAMLDETHDLLHKATGWLLREAGKTDMRRLERYLRDRGAQVPRTALRYAIERFPDPARRALLESTR